MGGPPQCSRLTLLSRRLPRRNVHQDADGVGHLHCQGFGPNGPVLGHHAWNVITHHWHGWGGPQLTPGPPALTISCADAWAQPAPGPVSLQVRAQVEAAAGPAVLRQWQAGTQVGGPVTQECC